MRRGSHLPQVFLCRGNLHNSRRQGSHSYGKSGWSCCTSHHFSAILIQDLAFVKLTWLAVVGMFARCLLSVGQALLPVRLCCGDIVPDRRECLSYPVTWPTAPLVKPRHNREFRLVRTNLTPKKNATTISSNLARQEYYPDGRNGRHGQRSDLECFPVKRRHPSDRHGSPSQLTRKESATEGLRR